MFVLTFQAALKKKTPILCYYSLKQIIFIDLINAIIFIFQTCL